MRNEDKSFRIFKQNFTEITKVIGQLSRPEGARIKELCQKLGCHRRSVFRIIKILDEHLHFPLVIKRYSFGGEAIYRFPESFIQKFSGITIPKCTLSFNQAVMVYIILKDDIFSGNKGFEEFFERLVP